MSRSALHRSRASEQLARNDAAPRVVIDNGEYWLQNKGDLAMLDVTVGRLLERWPAASVGVMTFNPPLLRSYEPRAVPLAQSEGGEWGADNLFRRLPNHVAPSIVGPLARTWRESSEPPRRVARRIRDRMRNATRKSAADSPAGLDNASLVVPDAHGRSRIPRAVDSASLVLALGGGYVADVDPDQAHRTFNILERATALGVPTAMLGQGLGPLENPELVARAKKILPSVDLIALREERHGPTLLAELGVDEERLVITGDDAVELAYGVRTLPIGSGIGLCLRIAPYSPVDAGATESIGSALQASAAAMRAPLVPMAVSDYKSEDRRTTLPLVEGYADVIPILGRYSSARELAARVGKCRVVVTGAYHVAVFALAQGIPVVAMSASRYYDDKFVGLDGMFGGGVHPVALQAEDLERRLSQAIRTAWEEAPMISQQLLASAERQIKASRMAYERVYRLVESPDRPA